MPTHPCAGFHYSLRPCSAAADGISASPLDSCSPPHPHLILLCRIGDCYQLSGVTNQLTSSSAGAGRQLLMPGSAHQDLFSAPTARFTAAHLCCASILVLYCILSCMGRPQAHACESAVSEYPDPSSLQTWGGITACQLLQQDAKAHHRRRRKRLQTWLPVSTCSREVGVADLGLSPPSLASSSPTLIPPLLLNHFDFAKVRRRVVFTVTVDAPSAPKVLVVLISA